MECRLAIRYLNHLYLCIKRHSSTALQRSTPASAAENATSSDLTLNGKLYSRDEWTNITPKIAALVTKNQHLRKNHPLWLIKERIAAYFNWKYPAQARRSPAFAILDSLDPVVTIEQNFDSLLVPKNHPSRARSDTYYVNKDYLLRAHTSAHQSDLLRSGLREFLIIGDVYRRDEIDSTHFPVFHQCEGVRLRHGYELNPDAPTSVFAKVPDQERIPTKQQTHTQQAADLVEKDLKGCLEGLIQSFFGQKAELRWSTSYFPFTHPSWELEVKFHDEWLELLGCGVMEQQLLNSAGIDDQIGWAFGVGLERIAMKLYDIPDIRLFWSEDSGFLSQFDVGDNVRKLIKYKPTSVYPQCTNDISFWIPESFQKNDFFELVRTCGGDLVEQVRLIDEFTNPKTGKQSQCYKIIYRHMEKTLTKEEANVVHNLIQETATKELGVKIR